MLSLFWARSLTRTNFGQWIRTEGCNELMERMAKEQRGAILVSVHQGNWEWACLAGGFCGMAPVSVAAHFKNEALERIFTAAREHSGVQIIPQDRSMIRMLKALHRGGAIALLGDLSFVRGRMAAVVDAWGLKMVIPSLPALLAQRTGALLVPVTTEPLPDGTCRIIAHSPVEAPPDASITEIAQRCWDVFQHEITRRPELWLWPYKFFRHQPHETTRAYPFYANETKAFEKLLRVAETPTAAREHLVS